MASSFADLKRASDARAKAVSARRAARDAGEVVTTDADALPIDLTHVRIFIESVNFRPKFADKVKVDDYDIDEQGRYLMSMRFRLDFAAGQSVVIERTMRLTPDEYDSSWSRLVGHEVRAAGQAWLHVSSTEQSRSSFDTSSVRTTYWIDFGELVLVDEQVKAAK